MASSNSSLPEGDKNIIHSAIDRFTESHDKTPIYNREQTKRRLKVLRTELKQAHGITRKSIQTEIDLLKGKKVPFKRLLDLI